MVISHIHTTAHGAFRLRERQVPAPRGLELRMLTKVEEKSARESYREEKNTLYAPRYVSGRLTFRTTDGHDRLPIYVFEHLGRGRLDLITCWWVDKPLGKPWNAVKRAMALFRERYDRAPRFDYRRSRGHWRCLMLGPEGIVCEGIGPHEKQARQSVCRRFLQQVGQ